MRRIQIHIDSVVLDGAVPPDPEAFGSDLEHGLADLARRHRGPWPSGAAAHLRGGNPVSAELSGGDVAQSVWGSIVADNSRSAQDRPGPAGPAPTSRQGS